MPKVHPFLWFDKDAEEAMNFYVAIFPNSKVLSVQRYGPAGPGPEGSVMTADFELDGQRVSALNGGPVFSFSEAVSFVVDCDGQEEVDYYWERLLADGGQPSQCGWLKDRFGFSWQVVPKQLFEAIGGPDAAGRQRAVQAMMQMIKLDVAALQRAYRGDAAA
jgi:predicted 3-demethylubiquinone-9 3-methyltransferase (glyoxalase superfamily)